jgi:RNA polymerase sigma-70 factor (ECF subfamily)
MRLFVKHERNLRVFARSMLPNWPAVDDVLQEASVVMWKKLHQLEKEEDFFTWARVIVRYEALRARRIAARDRLVLSEETLQLLANEAMPTTEDDLEKERAALNRCLKKMGYKQRELLFAASRRDGGVKKLAEATNRTANSLYKLIGRLRASLRKCALRQLQDEGVTHG